MYDIMNKVSEKTIQCLDKGFVTLVDVSPRLVLEEQQTADSAIVQMARVSYGIGTKTISEDRGLIRYLMRHAHTSPFEGVSFKFHCKLPLFVARQMVRHRTASLNEISARYSVLKDEFYFPDETNVRLQSKNNKQGGEDLADALTSSEFLTGIDKVCDDSYEFYETFLGKGISREQARMVLPVNIYTEWYWVCDLHNLLHFLQLRCDAHAQYEIRVFADAMLQLITPLVPYAVEAWNDYHFRREAVLLTRLEVDALKEMLASSPAQVATDGYVMAKQINSDNSREKEEWKTKLSRLGVTTDF